MGLIHILDTEVSNKIAAGEVVERPLSIVKELVENSIDAGATVITVEIKDGGVAYIRVSDNGSGMSEDDAKICFLRHATSKIRESDDLDAIYTLGFRGEALSSIGAVAKVKISTKQRNADMGVCVTCEGGEILSSAVSGTADGTVVEVRELFYNTPARRKFLKKPATEGGYIGDIVGRYIFAHPEISFKLIRDGKEILFSPGDGNLINAVYAVYGKDYAKNMLAVDYEFNGIRVTGVIGKGTLCRANRGYETFLVNKRYVKSALMMKALEEAYKNQIMISKFPTCILNVELEADKVDINVHPTKLECKFSNEQDIYQAIYHGAKNALYALPNIPSIERNTPEQKVHRWEKPEREVGEQATLEELFRKKLLETKETVARQIAEITAEREAEAKKGEVSTVAMKVDTESGEITEEIERNGSDSAKSEENGVGYASKEPKKIDCFALLDYANAHIYEHDDGMTVKSPRAERGRVNREEKPEDWRDYLKRAMNTEKSAENLFTTGDFRVIGQVFDTYILIEKDDKLLMIDQHAAHERLNYESLKAELNDRGVMSQTVLEPIEVRLAADEWVTFKDNEKLFYNLGFECAVADGDTIEITSIPSGISWSDTEPLFLELLTQMQEMKQEVIGKREERLLYTISCKAAIKANMKISDVEMRKLAERVFALENINTCPHGRPIVITMSKKEIEKNFKRIV